MGKIYEALMKAEEGEQLKAVSRQQALVFADGFDPRNELVVLNRPGSAVAEQFRFWRSQVVWPQDGNSPRTIQITSSLPGEGKTFAAANLAIAISQGLDEYVLLVDMDLRNSRLNKVFGFHESPPGLSEHLAENSPLEDLLLKSSLPKLTVLTAGSQVQNPAELISSKRMKAFVEEVRNRYPDRYVIIDSPPIEMAPESLVIANEVDGIFLMVLKASTPRDTLASSLERLKREKMLGIIFNGDLKSQKYYQAYKSGKGSGFGYGYAYD